MYVVDQILMYFVIIFGLLSSYTIIYQIMGLVFPSKKFKETKEQYNYAVILCARNEEKVIGQLIKSLKKQTYPQDKLTIFVVAHNCTDQTAQVAIEAGAIVYEFNNDKRRKGYAIDYCLQQIKQRYEKGVTHFDGYFLFDADNVISPNYVAEMNKAFDNKKYDMYNGYTEIKNFGDTFVSSYSSILRYSDNTNGSRARSILGISRRTMGTGCLIRSHLLAEGWKWYNLVEDTEFSDGMIAKGYRLTFVESAGYFDEQPLTLKILIRQRMRWTKGRFQCFFKLFPRLVLGIIAPYDFTRKRRMAKVQAEQDLINKQRAIDATETKPTLKPAKPYNFFTKALSEVQKRASCYDSLINLFPSFIFNITYGFLYPLGTLIHKAIAPDGTDIKPMLIIVLSYYFVRYINWLISYIITIVREHRHMRINPILLILYLPFWPLLSIVLEYTNMMSIFIPIKWKTIPHVVTNEIEDMYEEQTLSQILYEKKGQRAEQVNHD